jgi:hypothetical protein
MKEKTAAPALFRTSHINQYNLLFNFFLLFYNKFVLFWLVNVFLAKPHLIQITMLSLILSRLFKLAFLLFLVHAAGKITSDLMRKPFTIPTGENSFLTLGSPGIVVPAYKAVQSDKERRAPDTSVVYEIYSSTGIKVGGGRTSINTRNYLDDTSSYMKGITKEYGPGIRMTKDSQVTIIWHQAWDLVKDQSFSSYGFDSLNDGRVAVSATTEKNNGELIRSADTLPNMPTAKIFQATNQRVNKYNISEEFGGMDNLRVTPTSGWQLVWFVLYDLLRLASFALLLLTISRLFQNFYHREYFTRANVKLLKASGFYLLIPQVLLVILYWAFLFGIHPVKLFLSTAGEFDTLAQYDISAGFDFPMVFLGLALLVLSYIFRDGTELKEYNAVTI